MPIGYNLASNNLQSIYTHKIHKFHLYKYKYPNIKLPRYSQTFSSIVARMILTVTTIEIMQRVEKATIVIAMFCSIVQDQTIVNFTYSNNCDVLE